MAISWYTPTKSPPAEVTKSDGLSPSTTFGHQNQFGLCGVNLPRLYVTRFNLLMLLQANLPRFYDKRLNLLISPKAKMEPYSHYWSQKAQPIYPSQHKLNPPPQLHPKYRTLLSLR